MASNAKVNGGLLVSLLTPTGQVLIVAKMTGSRRSPCGTQTKWNIIKKNKTFCTLLLIINLI